MGYKAVEDVEMDRFLFEAAEKEKWRPLAEALAA
jgi:hypothetical protein